MLCSGMDITIVKDILGHENLDTTEIYAQISKLVKVGGLWRTQFVPKSTSR